MKLSFQKVFMAGGAIAVVTWFSLSHNPVVAQSANLHTFEKSIPERVKYLEENMKYANPVGEVTAFTGDTPPEGWVFANGQSIGNSNSNATGRANKDTRMLYNLLWHSFKNDQLPIQINNARAERGNSSDSDFEAGKCLPLPDLRGRIVAGNDKMGTADSAHRLTNEDDGNSGINGTILGSAGGVDRITLTAAQLAPHTHGPGTFAIKGGYHTHRLATWETDKSGHFKLLRASIVGTNRGTAAIGKHPIDDSMWHDEQNPNTHEHPSSEWSGQSGINSGLESGNAKPHSIVQPTIILVYIIRL